MLNSEKELIINTDGGSRGNPGQAAIGIVIRNSDREILHQIAETIGITTNNVAEYTAVREALKFIKSETCEAVVSFFLDSELVVRQLTGIYKIKDPTLRNYLIEIKELENCFPKVSYTHVKREFNKEADALVNKALDAETA